MQSDKTINQISGASSERCGSVPGTVAAKPPFLDCWGCRGHCLEQGEDVAAEKRAEAGRSQSIQASERVKTKRSREGGTGVDGALEGKQAEEEAGESPQGPGATLAEAAGAPLSPRLRLED